MSMYFYKKRHKADDNKGNGVKSVAQVIAEEPKEVAEPIEAEKTEEVVKPQTKSKKARAKK